EQKSSLRIGQFGVGFYSAFIVADRVTLTTRRGGEQQGVRWISDGGGEYTLESVDKAGHGTAVTLHLREGEDEFLDDFRLRHLVRTYSDHVAFPIEMLEQVSDSSDDENAEEGEDKQDKTPEFEQVNSGAPLWTRPKSELSDDDYTEFYKHTSHDFEAPLTWSHNKVEGSQEYTSLLFIPARAPFDLYDPQRDQHGIKLYVQRVFIMDDADKLMPRYLRFVRGIIDSNDLPLNVSREILQNNRVLDNIRAGSLKKIIGPLEKMANTEPANYTTFWGESSPVLKEGIVEDAANKEKIAKLLRFATTKDESEPGVSLDDYIERMAEGQDKIYYITADNIAAAKNSPHLEVFRKKDIEVLLLTDRVDEWVMAHLTEYQDKQFQS